MKNNTLQENMPSGWRHKALGDLVLIKKGEQLNRLAMDVAGKYPALNGGINPSGYTDKWNTEANTITISEGGNSCGYVNLNKERFWCGGHCYALLDLEATMDNSFLYQALKSKQGQLMKLRVGSGLPNIQKRSVDEFPLIFPKLKSEQQKIAEILGAVDEDIAETQKVIEATEKLKRGLMQQLFIRGIGHTKFKETKIGQIPVEWNVVSIRNSSIKLIDGDRGVNYPKQEDFSSEGFCLFLSAKNVSKNGFVFNETSFVSKEKDKALRKGKLERGDIILTSRGTVGNVAYYDEKIPFDNIRINSGMLIVRHGEQFDPVFLYRYFSSPQMEVKYSSMGSGSAQPQLPVGSLEQVEVPLIPIKEQKEIADIISTVDEKILANKKLKENLILLKRGLMQDLLSGKVRVVDIIG